MVSCRLKLFYDLCFVKAFTSRHVMQVLILVPEACIDIAEQHVHILRQHHITILSQTQGISYHNILHISTSPTLYVMYRLIGCLVVIYSL